MNLICMTPVVSDAMTYPSSYPSQGSYRMTSHVAVLSFVNKALFPCEDSDP